MPRVALIHALAHSVAPINDAMAGAWPECVRMNLLDDSLSADLAASPDGLGDAMTARFIALADYAVGTGAQGILFTCSAFGPCIDAVARRHAGIPVLKPNEAMVVEAVATGKRIGLVASFGPTLQSMPAEFPAGVELRTTLAEGALEALNEGDAVRHDALVVEAASRLVDGGCGVVALAQFSLARAADAVSQRCGVPVLTTVDSAVRALRARLSPSPSPASGRGSVLMLAWRTWPRSICRFLGRAGVRARRLEVQRPSRCERSALTPTLSREREREFRG